MEVIILHGNGLIGQLNKLAQIKKNFNPLATLEFSGKEIDFEKMLVSLKTPQFFSEKRLVVLENFSETEDLKVLPTDDLDLTVVIRFSKSLLKSSQIFKSGNLIKAQFIEVSEIEGKNIFPFLDKLAEKNPQALSQLDNLLKDYGGQYLLTMIFYLLRRLILISKTLPPFVVKKLEKQKLNFSQNKVTDLYKLGLETDFKIKSGLMDEKLGLSLFVNQLLI